MVVTPESSVTVSRICIWLPFCLTSRNPCCEIILQTSRPDSRLSLGNNKLPLCVLFFLMLHSRNFRVMLDFNGEILVKVDKETQNFALRSVL